MFTKNFGKVLYSLDPSTKLDIPDLTRFAGVAAKYKLPIYSLDYTIKEGERIDQISNKIYGTPDRWFLIALFNDFTDLINEWPMTREEFRAAMIKRYGVANPLGIHHWTDPDGLITDPVAMGIVYGLSPTEAAAKAGLIPVTILDHETALNEARRKIKILDPDRVGMVEDALRKEYWNV